MKLHITNIAVRTENDLYPEEAVEEVVAKVELRFPGTEDGIGGFVDICFKYEGAKQLIYEDIEKLVIERVKNHMFS